MFEKFLSHNQRNKRTLSNGGKLSSGTKTNYQYLFYRLRDFQKVSSFPLRITSLNTSNKRIYNQEKRYMNRFYKSFTSYLYDDRGMYDNTVGANIKGLKTFYKWVNIELGIHTGDFYKKFHVWKEEIPIIALSSDQLSFLIFDEEFHNSLGNRLRRTKDIFVFGCTIALRISDLLNLKKSQIVTAGDAIYVRNISQKTGRFTQAKLPNYCIDIINRNKTRKSNIFAPIGAGNLNK